MAGTKIEFWRSFFQNLDHDLWTVIDRAITIAALDYPEKLREKRDGFAEKLFARPSSWEELDHGLRGSVCRYSGVSQATGDEDYAIDMGSGNRDAACTYEEQVLVEDEMKEVADIKKQLMDPDKTDADIVVLLEQLTKLELSIETLKATNIGKSVNTLRKHKSAQIRLLAKKLIRSWKLIADEWAKSLPDVQACAPGNDVEFGLPAPPIDDGELLAALEMSQMSQFMDLMDNDMANGCSDKRDDSPIVQISHNSSRASHSPMGVSPFNNNPSNRMAIKEQGPFRKAGYPSDRLTETHRKERPHQHRPVHDAETTTTRRTTTTQSLGQNLEEHSIKDRLAAAKRKLQEGYQQAETAKKQRTVQVMGLEDLPKGTGPTAKPVKRVPPGHGGATKPSLPSHSNHRLLHRR